MSSAPSSAARAVQHRDEADDPLQGVPGTPLVPATFAPCNGSWSAARGASAGRGPWCPRQATRQPPSYPLPRLAAYPHVRQKSQSCYRNKPSHHTAAPTCPENQNHGRSTTALAEPEGKTSDAPQRLAGEDKTIVHAPNRLRQTLGGGAHKAKKCPDHRVRREPLRVNLLRPRVRTAKQPHDPSLWTRIISLRQAPDGIHPGCIQALCQSPGEVISFVSHGQDS